jgi:hypothetical protein
MYAVPADALQQPAMSKTMEPILPITVSSDTLSDHNKPHYLD